MSTTFSIIGSRRRIGVLGSLGLSLLGIATITVGLISAFGKGPVSPAAVFFSVAFVFVLGATGYFSLLGKGFSAVLSSGYLVIVVAVSLSYGLGVITKSVGMPILRSGSLDFWSLVLMDGFCLLEGFFLYLSSSNVSTGKPPFD